MVESNYICHHGIKGQKWGVRRYQNEDGSLTPAGKERLKTYKNYETGRINSKYNKRISKAESKIDRLKEKGASEKRLDKAQEKKDRLEARKLIESDYVKKMTYEDMKAEQIAVGANIATSLLLTVGTFLLAPTTGFYMISFPDTSRTKENRRRTAAGADKLKFMEHGDNDKLFISSRNSRSEMGHSSLPESGWFINSSRSKASR